MRCVNQCFVNRSAAVFFFRRAKRRPTCRPPRPPSCSRTRRRTTTSSRRSARHTPRFQCSATRAGTVSGSRNLACVHILSSFLTTSTYFLSYTSYSCSRFCSSNCWDLRDYQESHGFELRMMPRSAEALLSSSPTSSTSSSFSAGFTEFAAQSTSSRYNRTSASLSRSLYFRISDKM